MWFASLGSQFTAEVDDDDDRESHKFLANGMMDKKKRYEEEYVRSISVFYRTRVVTSLVWLWSFHWENIGLRGKV